MEATRPSLLLRVKNPRDTQAWSEFYELYAPLLYRYARARGLSHEDAEDVQATCYAQLARQIRHFDYDRSKGGFKAWLCTLAARRVVDLRRKRREEPLAGQTLEGLAGTDPAPDQAWEEQWKYEHLRYCLEQVRNLVPRQTFEAFEMLVHGGHRAHDVGARLGLTANQVYKAKARILDLVRHKMAELFPELADEGTGTEKGG
jgi:RNA polymerase sigma-70 factor (ECF subfamily)